MDGPFNLKMLLASFGAAISTAYAIDHGQIATVALTILIALFCSIIAAQYAIRQAKKDISGAFQDHIRKMHREHKDFVKEVRSNALRPPEP